MELGPWNFKPWSLIRVDHLREETVCQLHKLHLLFWLFIQRSFVGASEATLWKENSELVFSCCGNWTRSLIDTYHWKYRTSNLYLISGFWHKCTDRSKPNVKKWWVLIIACKWVPNVQFDFDACVDSRHCLTDTSKLNSTLGTFSGKCPEGSIYLLIHSVVDVPELNMHN